MKKAFYYLLASGLALFVTFTLPGGGPNTNEVSYSELFFGLSSLFFLGVFIAILIIDEFNIK